MKPLDRRAHKPRIRGCYHCSRRRINCDRSLPVCRKCASQQLPCSGYGKRIRFANDLFAQGKAPGGIRVPAYQDSGHWLQQGRLHDANLTTSLVRGTSREPYQLRCMSGSQDLSQNDVLHPDEDKPPCVHDRATSHITLGRGEKVTGHVICTELPILDPWTNYLFLCFSTNIAPKLITIDDKSNGWRCLVLPMAHQDDLIKDAVTSISTFFYANVISGTKFDCTPERSYLKVIQGLRRRQDILAQDRLGRRGVVVALLVLWATIMVNGFSDFRVVHKLLEGAWSANRLETSNGDDDLDAFLRMQVEKIRGYAAPFLSQEQGIAVLRQTKSPMPSTSRGWDEFRSYCESYASLGDSMSAIYNLHVAACNIYLARAKAGIPESKIEALVAEYRIKLELLADDCPGRHLLVWPTFIVATESKTTALQEYFANVLCALYHYLGFANVLKALDYLAAIWATSGDSDWTKLCTNFEVFIF